MATYINLGIWIATGCYVFQTIAYLSIRQKPQAVMMAAYAVANLGIIWSIPIGS